MVNWLYKVDWLSYSEWLLQWFEVVLFCLWRLFFLLGGGVGIFIISFFPPRISDSISIRRAGWCGRIRQRVLCFFDQLKGTCKVLRDLPTSHVGIFHPPPFESLDSTIFFVDEMRCYQHSVLNLRGIFLPQKYTFTRWFNVTFWSSSWRSLNNLKGHLTGDLYRGWNTTQLYRDYDKPL